jgi:hypothetical protein
MSRLSILVVAGLALPACALLLPGSANTASSAALGGGSWDGPECKRALYQLDELGGYDYNAKDTVVDPSPEAQVLLQICLRRQKDGFADHTIPQHPRIKPLHLDEAWYAEDDWHLDVVSAAVFAVGQANESHRPNYQGFMTKAFVGVALLWSRIITPEMLEQGLATVKIPASARTAMVDAFRAVPGNLTSLLTDDERKVLVDIPLETYGHRQEHYKKFHAFYDRFDKLRAEAQATRDNIKALDRVVVDLVRLRSEFFAACGTIECRAMPLYGHATTEIAQLYVLRNNALAARAESLVFAREGSYIAGFAEAVNAAQDARIDASNAAWEKYRTAKDSGNDDKTARRLAGDVPAQRVDLGLVTPLRTKMSLPNYAAAIDKGEATPGNATVDHVVAGGATRTIVFKTNRYEDNEEYDCQRTNRITRINSDGTLEYEENCKTRKVTRSQLQHAPLSVPAGEAVGIQQGDQVSFTADGNKGYVLEVKRGVHTVQVRGDRVRG